jgi:arginine decarboxylase-like protein
MKKLCIALLLLNPVIAYAEKPASMDNEHMGDQNMQMMAKKMQEMQKCMESINKSDLAEVEKESIQFEKKIRSLCSEGKRDQAQKEALSFGKKISKHPVMKSMNKCTESMRGALQNMPMPGQDMDFTNRHACDELSGTD